jgi:hypothetical protein
MLALASICFGMAMALALFRFLFVGWQDFGKSLDAAFQGLARFSPKVWVWILCSVGSGFAAHHFLPRWFPGVFS